MLSGSGLVMAARSADADGVALLPSERVSVSVMTCSLWMGLPKKVDATAAILDFCSARLPPETIVADVPTQFTG